MRQLKCVANAEDFILYPLDIISMPTAQVLTPDILYDHQQRREQLTDSLINYLIILQTAHSTAAYNTLQRIPNYDRTPNANFTPPLNSFTLFSSSMKPQIVAGSVVLSSSQLVNDDLSWLLLERDVAFIRHVQARFQSPLCSTDSAVRRSLCYRILLIFFFLQEEKHSATMQVCTPVWCSQNPW